MAKTLHHYVNGRRLAPKGGRFGDVFNPATGEISGKVPLASAAEVNEAVAAAKAAFPGWAKVTPMQRARVLFRFKGLLEANMDKIAELVQRLPRRAVPIQRVGISPILSKRRGGSRQQQRRGHACNTPRHARSSWFRRAFPRL